MTFFRHFVERPEFEILVVTSSSNVGDQPLPYVPITIGLPPWWERLSRTRLGPWLHSFQLLKGGVFLDSTAIAAARKFCPDAVFTVAGSWDWTALAAQKMARRLGVPLVASFNDWYDYGGFPAGDRFRSKIEGRFRRFYQEADLALCTCEGMQEALGVHRSVHVWYPTGAPVPEESDDYLPVEASATQPLTVFFGGSLGDWYGPMLEELVTYCCTHHPSIRFQIYGALETWSAEFGAWARNEGVFGGRVPFEELRDRALAADLLLLPMGFGEECAHVERTSFKTKFLDYLSFRRPILVWGPEYCSAVRVAREFDSAECVLESKASACGEAIAELAWDPLRRRELIRNAREMYEDRFHPDRIHEQLVEQIDAVIENHKGTVRSDQA